MHAPPARRHALRHLAGLLLGPAAARATTATAPPAPSTSPATAGFAARPLRFPADHGAHPAQRIEWWYLTGWLAPTGFDPAGGDAPGHGVQLTFFRSRTEVPADHPSAFAAHQLVIAHLALTQIGDGRLQHDQRIARTGFGLVEAAEGDTRLRLRDWMFQREAGPAGGSVYRARFGRSTLGDGLELEARSSQPLLLQGAAGWSRKGPRPEQASLYYSQPQLALRVRLPGRAGHLEGRAWLDHEWSDSLLDAQSPGWDWLGINLFDGSALTAFRLRRQDGSALWAGGSFRPAGASAAQVYAPQDLHFEPLRLWQSPGTGARYPVHWRVHTPKGVYELRALADAQELDSRASSGTVYWEGLSELRDATGRRVGLGYLEMTGYAGRLQLP